MAEMTRREALRIFGAGMAAMAATSWSDVLGKESGVRGVKVDLATRKIPSSGELLPVIGLGTWQTFDVKGSAAELAPLKEVLLTFSELGGKLVDSSPMYGRSEEVAGRLAGDLGLHPGLFIATKVWTRGKKDGIAQMEDSMRKLGKRPLDLMQVHNLVDVDTHLETLNAWKREGRIRYIGITHYSAGSHGEVAKILAANTLDFLQINYSVGEREAENRLLPMALERGVAVIANRPFAGGDLFRRLRSRPLPGWAEDIDCRSWAQILLKFVVSHPAMTCAIPATSNPAHLRDNMGAGLGRMPDEKLRAKIASEAV